MSNQTILEQLRQKMEELQSLVLVQSHLDELVVVLTQKFKELGDITTALRKEEKDVEKLEGKGFKPLFYKILGDKEKQLEKERQEYLAVSLKYNALKEEIELMEFEKELLSKKVMNVKSMKEDVQRLKKLREKEIIQTDPIKRKDILYVLSQYDTVVKVSVEITEALKASDQARKNLAMLSDQLKQVLNWGKWQGQSRSGYSQMMKRNKLINASKLLASTQRSLDIFAKEMRDLGENNMHYQLNLKELAKFTDFFFDNLITDWIIQQKIRNTLNNVVSIYDKLNRISKSLELELKETKLKQKKYLEKKDQLLLS